MTSAARKTGRACVWCGSDARALVLDLEGDLVCEDDALCGTSIEARKPPVTITALPSASPASPATPPRRTLGQLAAEAEAAAMELQVMVRRSRREGHRLTREVIEAQDRSRRAVLDYHRATQVQTARGAR